MAPTAIVRLRCLLKIMTSNRDLQQFLKNPIILIHNFSSKIIRTLQLSKLLLIILRLLRQFQLAIFLRIHKMHNHEDIQICLMQKLPCPVTKRSLQVKILDILCNLRIKQSLVYLENILLHKVHHN